MIDCLNLLSFASVLQKQILHPKNIIHSQGNNELQQMLRKYSQKLSRDWQVGKRKHQVMLNIKPEVRPVV